MSHYFIGIQVKPLLAEQLTEWQKHFMQHLPFKQWTDKEDFHITLAFLGEVGEKSIETLRNELYSITAYTAFDLNRTSLGTFGNKHQPRVLWLGVENNPMLNRIQQQVVQICEIIGYKNEKRAYTPHITIAKKWADQKKTVTEDSWNKIISNMPSLAEAFNVDAVELYKVHPSSTPKYEIIQRFPLRHESFS
ncbi:MULTISPECIES: RNA 2',3'-cyclic phosphodiesterase [Oceanobacillus]|uniref:RNA 2',3'-cyclic phosphodiesterase n=1 Tax=Oceanobacillus aidingensis TaxID=645964 RepID=A0ABV9K0W2_9BACI|nr:RNA 2',3'-cyclic phosphodiesterase [Oceanobacillus oncorhynchi]MDM8102603.1 RNA 2',3'-cyclic phosphodiesterase [Oceanobacillus oncorhynchi]